ncbi:hypothetical protein DFH27DRAFT_561526 [Peziza echinospora]|nr:hypothetical protein DFH27DRAFT_561526 [Peziza echinospora]
MLALRTARAAARVPLAPGVLGRRMASGNGHDSHAHDAHHGHGHGPAAEEKIGKGFFVSIAVFVGFLAAYKLEQRIAGSDQSPLTRALAYYGDLEREFQETNTRHTLMVEQAGKDRTLFSSQRASGITKIKYIEGFNQGSPFNNQAGWAGGDMTAIKAHLEANQK